MPRGRSATRDPHRGPTQGTHTEGTHTGDPHRGPAQGTHTGDPHRGEGPTEDAPPEGRATQGTHTEHTQTVLIRAHQPRNKIISCMRDTQIGIFSGVLLEITAETVI